MLKNFKDFSKPEKKNLFFIDSPSNGKILLFGVAIIILIIIINTI
jgi:hypothetical protein